MVKHTEDNVDVITAAPQSGIWRLEGDDMVFSRFDYHRRAVETEDEAFYMRISGVGDYRYEGADLGILITRGRLMTDDFGLNERARRWIRGLKACYEAKPLSAAVEPHPEPGAFKIL